MKTTSETQFNEAIQWNERVLRVVGHLLLREDGKAIPGIRSAYVVEPAHSEKVQRAHDQYGWDHRDHAELSPAQLIALATLAAALEGAVAHAAQMQQPWLSARLTFDHEIEAVVGQLQLVEGISFLALREAETSAVDAAEGNQAEGLTVAEAGAS